MTSRPDWDISHVLRDLDAKPLPHDSVDVERLAQKLLSEVAERYKLTCPWPESNTLEALVQRSGRLFIWIRVACAFVAQRDPQRRLGLVLESDPLQGAGAELNKLYRDALLNHAEKEGENDDEFYERFREILGCIANLRNPLAPEAIDALLGFPGDIQSRYMIELLESFLCFTDEGAVRPIHPSFIEFLTNENRCKSPLLFLGKEHQQILGKRCMQVMQVLKRNICGLEDPLIRNDSTVSNRLPPDLLYACRFWSYHIQSLPPDYDSYCLVEDFFSTKIIFWLEVMSLAGLVDELLPSLDAARAWVEHSSWKSPLLLSLISDTRKFVEEFRPILLKSAGHIYESALPLTPHGTMLYQHSSKLVGKIPTVRGGYRDWDQCRIVEVRSLPVTSAAWSPNSKTIAIGTGTPGIYICNATDGSFVGEVLIGHTKAVESVAFSPDGRTVASGSYDQTIAIWDTDNNTLVHKFHTGLEVSSVAFSPDGRRVVSGTSPICTWNVEDGTLAVRFSESLEGKIISVAFSPDGCRVVSGSVDGTIGIWNAVNGELIGKPFVGHNGCIYSVAFSGDGGRVVSGSLDKTVRIWGAADGTQVVNPLAGHDYAVYSVGFSPDGRKIVSGSNDDTIRIWDAIKGTLIGRPLKRHAAPVTTVSFSPNGKQLFSGSSDATLRIWSAADADLMGEVADGHSDRVLSLCFSPDGSKIASASWDTTVCLWSAVDGALIGGPLKGHTDGASCVRFSPDGTKIASGSWDNTVRIWDVSRKSDGSLLLEGHRDKVWTVEFSPDGTKLVSGSSDSTLRIWQVADGTPVGEPLQGEWTVTIAFSPDGSRFISMDKTCSIRIWNADGSLDGQLWVNDNLTTPPLSPRGTKITSGVYNPNGALAGHLRGRYNSISSIAFSPDGTQIISVAYDRTIRVWDTAKKSLLFAFPQQFFESWRGTEPARSSDNAIPESTFALYEMLRSKPNGLTLLGGWIRVVESSKRLWIPPRYRGTITVNSNRVCIGTSTGQVVVFETN